MKATVMVKLVRLGGIGVASLTPVLAADVIDVPGAAPTIQAAIDRAADGDQIHVAPGTYFERIDLLGKALTLRGTGGAPVTIIDGGGGGGGGQGGGSTVTCTGGEGPDTVLDGFTITGGEADFGGGMHNQGSCPTVLNCVFRDNHAGVDGGGMFNYESCPTVVNCVFLDNTGPWGVGMYNVHFSEPVVTNCTFVGNVAGLGGGGVFTNNSSPVVSNCIFAGNAPFGYVDNSQGSSTVISCVMQEPWSGAGTGNLVADPMLVDAAGGDVHLQAGSPAVNRGAADAPGLAAADFEGEARVQSCQVDIGADESPFEGGDTNGNGVPDECDPDCNGNGIPDDLDIAAGAPDVNRNGIPDVCDPDCDGNGLPDDLDLAAGAPDVNGNGVPDACELAGGDVNLDGVVDVLDLLQVILHWGPCPAPPAPPVSCAGDADGDGTVGVTDLIAVILGWGLS